MIPSILAAIAFLCVIIGCVFLGNACEAFVKSEWGRCWSHAIGMVLSWCAAAVIVSSMIQ